MTEPSNDKPRDELDALVQKKLAQIELANSDYSKDILKSSKNSVRILSECPEVLSKLLNSTTIDYCTEYSISILDLARQYCNKRFFEYLIAQGADLTIQGNKNNTIIHEAIEGCLEHNFRKRPHQVFGKIKNIYIDLVLSKHIECGTLQNRYNNDGLSYLHKACMIDRTDIVKFFLDNGEFVNRPIGDSSTVLPGYTPLHLAVRYCACETVKVLLDYGADKYVTDVEGISPLHLLLQWSMKIKDNINVDMPTPNEEFIRDLESNESTIQMMYEKGMNFPDGLNSLHIACTMSNSKEVVELLQTDMDLNCSIKSDAKLWPGYTALHFAAHFNIEILKILIHHGGDILIEDAKGFTPLDLCVQRYRAEQLHSIIISKPIWKGIQFADSKTKLLDFVFAMADRNSFSTFLSSMSDVNTFILLHAPIWPGCTPLHLAVLFAEREIENLYEQTDYKRKFFEEEQKELYDERITICLSLNADVTVQDAFGNTPLHLAYRLGKVNAVKLLLEHHPKLVNPIDSGGLSHLHIACAAQKIELVDSLLFGGADVNSQIFFEAASSAIPINDKRRPISNRSLPVPLGTTPLHIATEVENEAIVEVLVKRGANLYAKNAVGSTPMHKVVSTYWGEKFTKCPTLYENLKNVNVCGFTPLLVSASKNNFDAVERMLKFGVNVESAVGQVSTDEGESSTIADPADALPASFQLRKGYRALHFAVENKSLRMVELLLEHGADVFAKSDDGSIPLYMSFRRYCRDEIINGFFVKLLKSDHILQTRVQEETGITMLHVACLVRDISLAKKALDAGVHVNARTSINSPVRPNCTPLHFLDAESRADESSMMKLLRFLLDHGADVTMENNYHGGNPICSCFRGYDELSLDDEINDHSDYFSNKERVTCSGHRFG